LPRATRSPGWPGPPTAAAGWSARAHELPARACSSSPAQAEMHRALLTGFARPKLGTVAAAEDLIQAAHLRFARAAWSEPRDVPSLPDDVSGTALRRRAGIGPRPRGATQARAWRSRWPTPGGKSAPPPPGSARGRAQLQEVAAKHHVMPYPQRVNRPAGLVFKARARCPASRGSRSPGHGSRRSIS
jgi:hypothetical protein